MYVPSWDLRDRPLVCTTEDLRTFLLFLMDEEAREYELSNITAYSLAVRTGGPQQLHPLQDQHLRTSRNERYEIYEALRSHQRRISRSLKERLFSHVGWFFALKSCGEHEPVLRAGSTPRR